MFIEVYGKENKYIINVNQIEIVARVTEFTLVRLIGDPKPMWLLPSQYEILARILVNKSSNDLKQTQEIVPAKTTRQRKLRIPERHPFQLIFGSDGTICGKCSRLQRHPCHSGYARIECDGNPNMEEQSDANRYSKAQTDRPNTDGIE